MATTGELPRLRGIAHDAHVPNAHFNPPGRSARTDRAGLHRRWRSLAEISKSGTTARQKGACQRPLHEDAWQPYPSSSPPARPAWLDAYRVAEAA